MKAVNPNCPIWPGPPVICPIEFLTEGYGMGLEVASEVLTGVLHESKESGGQLLIFPIDLFIRLRQITGMTIKKAVNVGVYQQRSLKYLDCQLTTDFCNKTAPSGQTAKVQKERDRAQLVSKATKWRSWGQLTGPRTVRHRWYFREGGQGPILFNLPKASRGHIPCHVASLMWQTGQLWEESHVWHAVVPSASEISSLLLYTLYDNMLVTSDMMMDPGNSNGSWAVQAQSEAWFQGLHQRKAFTVGIYMSVIHRHWSAAIICFHSSQLQRKLSLICQSIVSKWQYIK